VKKKYRNYNSFFFMRNIS